MKMGQYYRACIIRKNKDDYEQAQTFSTYPLHTGAKLMEFSYYNTTYAKSVCAMLKRSPFKYSDEDFKPARFAVIGDYATDWDDFGRLDEDDQLLCRLAWSHWGDPLMTTLPASKDPWVPWYQENRIFVLNNTKLEYYAVDPDDCVNNEILPLFLLCSVGNGCGGGDYRGVHAELCGSWAFDEIEIIEAKEAPTGYHELDIAFSEDD